MKKITLIVPIIFLLLLAFGVKAQTQITDCPDNCNNSIMYTKGHFDDKAKICIYDLQEICKYGCQNDKDFTNPSCNALPPQDPSTSLEKIYSDILKIQGQTSNTDANYQKLYDEITQLKWQVYQNSPSLTVHGTEYTIGEMGKVWVQVLDANKTAVNNASCTADIYTPDGLRFVEKESMSFLEDGVYYYDFLAPNQIGVYPAIVNCFYVVTTVPFLASSGVADIGTTAGGNYTSTWFLDTVYWNVREETFNGTHRLEMRMNFTNVTQPVLQSNLNIIWTGIWNSAPNPDSISIYIMNFTSGKWTLLLNKIDDTGGSVITVSNSLSTTNATKEGYVKNGEVSLLFNDTILTDASATIFKSDYVHVDVVAQFSPQYQQIIGSGEIHVSSSTNLPYSLKTLCGDIITPTDFETMSACSIFTHDGEFPYPEGEIEGNISITALETKSDQFWNYITPEGISCSSIYWLKYYNGTSWVNVDLSTVIFSSELRSNCDLKVPIDLVKGTTYQYHIKMDNYMKYKVLQAKAILDVLNFTNPILCDPYAQSLNYTYAYPLLNSTILPNDVILQSCQYARDIEYWGYLFYNQSTYVTLSGLYSTYYEEISNYAQTKAIQYIQLLTGYVLQFQTNPSILNISLNTSQINSLLRYMNDTLNSVNNSVATSKDGIIFIGGTEYNSGATGISSVQFLKAGFPINTGTCNLTAIYYPNGSIFINNVAMTYLSGSNGIYSYSFTVPNTIGVYRESINCKTSGVDYYTAGSFHNSDWANNITNIYQLLQYMNITQTMQFNSLYNLIVSVNSSINQNIISVNNSVSEVLAQLQSVQNNLTQIYNLVNASNATIMNKLFRIQDEITSVNDTVKSMNQSIESHLNNISSALNSIQGNITEIKILSQEINVTVNEIVGILGNISFDISGLNSSIISHIDTSIANLEFNLTNLIISVNNTVLATNTTIMNKLFGIQNEIASLNQTIINGLMNISNVTVNITASQKEVINTMFALFGSQAKNKNYAYLGIGGGLTGFLTGGDSGAVYYCKDNATLASYAVQNQNWTGTINMTNSAILEDLQHCTYGCVQNACVIPQYMIWLYVLLALLAVLGIYLWLEKHGWSED